MNPAPAPLLIFGYGNPSRGDDALGPELLRRLEATREGGGLHGCDTLTDFQLQVEHALDLQGRDLVLFVDASVSAPAPFAFTRLTAERDPSYTTHAISPAAVLAVFHQVCREPPPPCFLLAIRGEAFELGQPLSPTAARHLEAALRFTAELLRSPSLEGWAPQAGVRPTPP
jgi:hydrogenase maturation protease